MFLKVITEVKVEKVEKRKEIQKKVFMMGDQLKHQKGQHNWS